MKKSSQITATDWTRLLPTATLLVIGLCGFASNARGQETLLRSSVRERTVASPAQRKVFVRSKALLVKASVVEDKLMKRSEFAQMGLVLTRDAEDADIILELRHDILTKYVYSAVDAHTQVVLAGGKVSSLGGTVAGKVAKRFLKQLAQGHP
jgi:hypothetical protein